MQKHPPIIMYGMKLLVTVSMETKRGTKNLTCDCTSHHETRPVCKVSDLYYLQFLRYRDLTEQQQQEAEEELGK